MHRDRKNPRGRQTTAGTKCAMYILRKGKIKMQRLAFVFSVLWYLFLFFFFLILWLSCLVLSCFFRVYPLGGLFLAHAEAGLHCTVQSITSPLVGCSGLMHLNHLGALTRTCLLLTSSPLAKAVFFFRCFPQRSRLSSPRAHTKKGLHVH